MSHWRQRKRYRNKNERQSHNDGSNNNAPRNDDNTAQYHNSIMDRNAVYYQHNGTGHRNGLYKKKVYSAQGELDFTHRSKRYRQNHNNYSSRDNGCRNYDKNENKKVKKTKQNPKYSHCPSPLITSVRSSNIQSLKEYPYMIREKSGGMNVKCYITQNSVYFIDSAFNISMLTDVFYGSHGFISQNKVILFDGELIVSQRTTKHGDKYMFYRITDCIAFDGQSIANKNSSNRHLYINKFIAIYTSKLREYAEKRNKMKNKKDIIRKKDSFQFEPGDDQDTAQNRLSAISTLLDNNYQYTRCIKDEIINLCRCNRSCDDHKSDIELNNNNNNNNNNILNDIELNVVPVLFIKSIYLLATAHNLQEVSSRIKYNDDANKCEFGYYYTHHQTEIKTKSGGILFIPQNNNYMMNRSGSDNEIQTIWKPIDLLTVDIKIMSTSNNRDFKMNDFIDFDALNMYVYDEDRNKSVWFNRINMGRNDVNDGNTPFWNEWHLKQRAALMSFIVIINQQKTNINHYIVECNYDFKMKSWSLFRLKPHKKRPSSLKAARDIISQMEQYLELNDIKNILK